MTLEELAKNHQHYEYHETTIPNDEAAFEKRKHWYLARGWELFNVATVIIGPKECYLTFRRLVPNENRQA